MTEDMVGRRQFTCYSPSAHPTVVDAARALLPRRRATRGDAGGCFPAPPRIHRTVPGDPSSGRLAPLFVPPSWVGTRSLSHSLRSERSSSLSPSHRLPPRCRGCSAAPPPPLTAARLLGTIPAPSSRPSGRWCCWGLPTRCRCWELARLWQTPNSGFTIWSTWLRIDN